jgi:hypothetical protein
LVRNKIILFSTSNSAINWDLPPNPPRGLLTFQKSKVPPSWGRDLGRGKSSRGNGAKNKRKKDLLRTICRTREAAFL